MRKIILLFLLSLSGFLFSQEEEAPMKILKQKTTSSQARMAQAMEVAQDPTKLIPTINGELKVSPEGAALYSIPIETPPGHNGMQPNLAITYNSQAGPGQFGYGWTLNGLSSITRGGKSKRVDGVAHGPQFTEDDPFYLDGMRLIPHPNGKANEYTTEKYANLKVVRNMTNSPEVYIWAVPKTWCRTLCFPILIKEADIANIDTNYYNIVYDEVDTLIDEFVVYYPDGRKAFYMQDSRLLGQFVINRMEDAFGNKIIYNYSVEFKVAYLQSINYLQKEDNSFVFTIEFNKELNPQFTFAYRNGVKMTNYYYIKQIVVKANGQTYREYNLQHDTNSNGEKRLVGAKIKNASGEELKPLSFGYESLGKIQIPDGDILDGSTHIKKNLGLPTKALSLGATALGDFDGDGKQEAVYIVEVEEDIYKNTVDACEAFKKEKGYPFCYSIFYETLFTKWLKDQVIKYDILWHENLGEIKFATNSSTKDIDYLQSYRKLGSNKDELLIFRIKDQNELFDRSGNKYLQDEYLVELVELKDSAEYWKLGEKYFYNVSPKKVGQFSMLGSFSYDLWEYKENESQSWRTNYTLIKEKTQRSWLVDDFDKDGRIDFFILNPRIQKLRIINDGSRWESIESTPYTHTKSILLSFDDFGMIQSKEVSTFYFGSLDFDYIEKDITDYSRYKQNKFFEYRPKNQFQANLFEFDGDGTSEIYHLDKNEEKILVYKFNLQSKDFFKIYESSNFLADSHVVGDFNGDGITDFLVPKTTYDLSKETNLQAFVEKIETSGQLYFDLYVGTGKGYDKDLKNLTLNNLAYCNTGNKVIPKIKKTSGFWKDLWSGPEFEDNSYFEYASCQIMPMDFNGDGKTDLVSFKKVGAINPTGDKKFLTEEFIVDNKFSQSEFISKVLIYEKLVAINYEYERDLSYQCPVENRVGGIWRETTYRWHELGYSLFQDTFVNCKKDFSDLNKLSFHENVYDANEPDGIFFEPYLEEDQVLDLGKIAISPYSFFIGGTQNIKNKSTHELKQDLRLYDPHQKNNIHFNLQRETGENRLVKIENGSGLAQYIEYGTYEDGDPLSAYQKTDKHQNLTYPYQVLEAQPGSYLVSKIHTEVKKESADQAKTLTQEYRYQDAIIHLDGLGHLGFGQTLVSDPYISDCKAYNSGTHEFTIEDCKRNSQESKPIFWTRSVQDPLQEGQTVEVTYGDLSGKNYFSKTTKEYQKFSKNQHQFVWYPTKEITHDNLKDITTTQTNFYDPNLLLLTKTTTDIGGEYSTQTEFSYEHTTNEDTNFYYGRITGVKTTQTNSKTGDTFSTEDRSELYPHGKAKTTYKKGNGTAEVKTHYTYDSYGNVTSERLEAIVETADETTEGVNLTTTTQYQYDFTNLQNFLTITSTNPEGQTATVVADAFGRKQRETSVLGLTTQYFYDSWGNPESAIDALGHTTRTKNEDFGNGIYSKSVEKAGTPKSLVFYNRLDQPFRTKTQTLEGKWILQDTEYDLYGRETRMSQPYFEGESPSQWDATYYDELNRPIKQVLHTGKIVETCYDKRTVRVTDDNILKVETQNAWGKTIESTDRGGTVTYTYYPNGTLKEANYDGVIVKVTQDGWGNKTKLEDPSAGTYEYKYDDLGRMLWEKTPKGITKHWYDEFGKPTQEETIGDASVGDQTYLKQEFVYDPVSKLPTEIKGWNQNVASPNFTYKTEYDQYYRIKGKTEEQAVFTYQTTTIFDDSQEAGGRVKENQSKVTLTTGEISQVITRPVYDANGIMTELKDSNNQRLWAVTATNARGQVEQLAYGNGFVVQTEYDEFGLPKNLKDYHSSKGTALEMAYNFNAARGILNSRTNKLFDLQENFGFDELNRLVEESQNGVVGKFSYDNRGRITGSTDMGKYSYFADNYQLKQIEHNAEGSAHRELFGDLQLQYNSHKKPTQIVGKLGTYQFAYNPLQTRAVMRFFATGSTEASLTKIYSADQAIEVEIRGNQTRILTFVDGGPYEASVIHTKTFGGVSTSGDGYLYLHKDYLGSVLAISDQAANILEQRSFDAWGSLTHLKTKNGLFTTQQAILQEILANGLILDRGYTGHEHLWAVDIINMNGRLYDPALKRFLSPDNFIQDPYNTQNFNRYGYVLNNPLIYTDPSGEFIFGIIAVAILAGGNATLGLTIGLIVGAAILDKMVGNAIAGNPLHWGIGKTAVFSALTAVVSAGIGNINFGKPDWLFRAGAHGLAGGVISTLAQGSIDGFLPGFAAGFASSLIAGGVKELGYDKFGNLNNFGKSNVFSAIVVASGALGGGLSAGITGGDIWMGAIQGAIVAGLNHMHDVRNVRNNNDKFVTAGIYGAGGEGAGDNPLLKEIVEGQGGKMFTSYIGEGDNEIINYLKEGYDNGKGIKIYGYSRGGNAAIRITNKLGEMGINVFQLVTFDPHSLTDNYTFQLKYNNVAYLYNYYQQNPRTGGQLGWWGDNPYWGSPIKTEYAPSGFQVNYTGEFYRPKIPVSHLNIISHVYGR